jgi:hypothetical protein
MSGDKGVVVLLGACNAQREIDALLGAEGNDDVQQAFSFGSQGKIQDIWFANSLAKSGFQSHGFR